MPEVIYVEAQFEDSCCISILPKSHMSNLFVFIVALKCLGYVVFHDHIANHTGVNRTVCSVFLNEFMWKRNLKVHMLHFHPAEIAYMSKLFVFIVDLKI